MSCFSVAGRRSGLVRFGQMAVMAFVAIVLIYTDARGAGL